MVTKARFMEAMNYEPLTEILIGGKRYAIGQLSEAQLEEVRIRGDAMQDMTPRQAEALACEANELRDLLLAGSLWLNWHAVREEVTMDDITRGQREAVRQYAIYLLSSKTSGSA